MSFNSFEFLIFFVVVYGLYLVLNHKWQNRMLLIASYVFYGFWNWRFLSLILISTILDYICGIKIHESPQKGKRKAFLWLSILGNLSIFGFFKYFDFFAVNLQGLLNFFGLSIQPQFLNIILPVGISFYTFQTMSYTIDIYRRRLKPTKQFLDFALFVSFFPQLVAGPIERARKLLPQILNPRSMTVNKFFDGCYLIFWGLFQKVFVADNLAVYVDSIYSSPPPYSGPAVWLSSFAVAFQIYCDFAGYSNIARGLSKLMGIDLMVNFNLPLLSTNPRELWSKWHITLASWFRDYVYVPLSLRTKNRGKLLTCRNIFITMLLVGLWHGASWTFVLWGAYHGVLLSVYYFLQPYLKKIGEPHSDTGKKVWLAMRIGFFFTLKIFSGIFFRSQSLSQCKEMVRASFTNFTFTQGFVQDLMYVFYFTFFLIAVEIYQYVHKDVDIFFKWPTHIKTAFWLIILCLVLYVEILGTRATVGGGSPFVYFQF